MANVQRIPGIYFQYLGGGIRVRMLTAIISSALIPSYFFYYSCVLLLSKSNVKLNLLRQDFNICFLVRKSDQFFFDKSRGSSRGQSRGSRGGGGGRGFGHRGGREGRGSGDRFRGPRGRGRGSLDGFRGRSGRGRGQQFEDRGRGRGGFSGRGAKRTNTGAPPHSFDKRPRLDIEAAGGGGVAVAAASKPPAAANKPLHPSWVAKQQQKKSAILPFQGKKVIFNEDD